MLSKFLIIFNVLVHSYLCIMLNDSSQMNDPKLLDIEDFSGDPFKGTILNRYVNFRFHLSSHVKMISPKDKELVAMGTHEPMIFSRFDWIMFQREDGSMLKKVSKSPRSVYSISNGVAYLLPQLIGLPKLQQKALSDEQHRQQQYNITENQQQQHRLLVLAGEDKHLSDFVAVAAEELKAITGQPQTLQSVAEFFTSRFSSIYYEAVDIRFSIFKTVPMGFTNFYVLKVSAGLIQQQINAAKYRKQEDKKLVFAAWGKLWHLDNKISDRRYLEQFLHSAAASSWVSRSQLSFDEYWSQLGEYKFALCPLGNGIQAPKLFEAMLLRVVPVVTHMAAFEDLVQLGFPILIIDHWQQLSEEFLVNAYHSKFAQVDWDKVDRMISYEGVWSLLTNEGKYEYPF